MIQKKGRDFKYDFPTDDVVGYPYPEGVKKPDFDEERPVSWSQISSFFYSQEDWWFKYCLHGKCRRKKDDDEEAFCMVAGCPDPMCPVVRTTKEMEFGKRFADSIEDGTCEIRELMDLLTGTKEYPFETSLGKIKLVGYADDFCGNSFRKLNEVKTGKVAWTQKRADGHGQLKMYCLENFLINKVPPEQVSVTLLWLPTEDTFEGIRFRQPVTVHAFRVRITMRDILEFAELIRVTHDAMRLYCRDHS